MVGQKGNRETVVTLSVYVCMFRGIRYKHLPQETELGDDATEAGWTVGMLTASKMATISGAIVHKFFFFC